MKKVVYLLASIGLFISLNSCTKKFQDNQLATVRPDQVININVSTGQTYTYTAGFSGTLSVTRQASHYQVSEAALEDNGSVIYKYSSVPGYTGSDEVTLAYNPSSVTSEGNTGCQANQNRSNPSNIITVFKINVTK